MARERPPRIASVAGVGETMITDWLTDLAASGHAASTVRLRGYQLRDFTRALGGVPAARHADRAQVVAWLAAPMSASTRASKHAALVGWFDWLIATGRRVEASPMSGLPRTRIPASTKRDIPDEVLAAAIHAAPAHVADAMILGRFAGLRAAEIAAVRGDDYADGNLFVVGKGGRSRLVPVGQVVAGIMRPHQAHLFRGRKSGHVRPGTITDWLRRALPGRWSAHSLRHAFATDFFAASGHDLLWTAQVLGHSSVETTRRYVHVQRAAEPVVARIGAGVMAA